MGNYRTGYYASLLYYLILNPNRSSEFLSFWVVSLSGMVLTTEFYADWLAMIKGLMGLGLFLTAILGLTLAPKKIKPVLVGGWIGYVFFGLISPTNMSPMNTITLHLFRLWRFH